MVKPLVAALSQHGFVLAASLNSSFYFATDDLKRWSTKMKRYMINVHLILILCITACAGQTFKPELYAFFNGMPKMSYDDEARMLKDLGYNGISQIYGGGDPLVRRVAAYRVHGLKVLSVYLEATKTPIDANLVKALANGGMIELTVKELTPEVIESIRQTAEMASQMNIRVALYPHDGYALSTMPQAIDLVGKVSHSNLGIMFNLSHFLKGEKAEDLESVLEKSAAHLFSVSICGADLEGENWDTLIQTLDKGTFPQKRLLALLKKLDFKGPVGLQCFGVKGDRRSNLKESMNAWKTILDDLQ
jgi:Xylose isomerase-like TIM barrel